jgi:hypothetical protein
VNSIKDITDLVDNTDDEFNNWKEGAPSVELKIKVHESPSFIFYNYITDVWFKKFAN